MAKRKFQVVVVVVVVVVASVVSLRLCVVLNSRRVVSLLKKSNCKETSLAQSPDEIPGRG
jgi:hypothetical protein